MRAHSAVARHCAFGAAAAAVAGLLAVFIGDVETRLSVRGWSGVMGADIDLRRPPLAVDLGGTSSPEFDSCCTRAGVFGGACCETVVEDVLVVGFAASASALRAALITCVANCAFSLSERLGWESGCFRASSRAAGRRFAAAVPGREDAAVPGREDGAPRAVFVVIVGACCCESASRGRRRDLRETTVAGVHVALDVTALRTASTCTWRVAI